MFIKPSKHFKIFKYLLKKKKQTFNQTFSIFNVGECNFFLSSRCYMLFSILAVDGSWTIWYRMSVVAVIFAGVWREWWMSKRVTHLQ